MASAVTSVHVVLTDEAIGKLFCKAPQVKTAYVHYVFDFKSTLGGEKEGAGLPQWFFKKNLSGLVPVVEDSQGQLISKSLSTCEYLDEAYLEKSFTDDPYKKACQRMTFEIFSKMPPLVTRFTGVQKGGDISGMKEELRKEFCKLEEGMTNEKAAFFDGDSLSMMDYLMWPRYQWLAALELMECIVHTPKLKLWVPAMQEDPMVSFHLIDAKTYSDFLSLYLQDSPDAYDYGL